MESLVKEMSPLISPAELKERIKEPGLIIIDAQAGSNAFETYRVKHISNALHVDLDTELSAKTSDPAKGGRHPLPDISKFALLLGKLGIDPSSLVVVYDNKGGVSAAARFWWMLKAAGHKKVQVLDGGLDAAILVGLPVSNEASNPSPKESYPVQEWKLPTVSLDTVKKAIADAKYLVIDTREDFRYRGEREPLDLVAGHIPNAVNVPYIKNLGNDGFFISSAKLADLYKSVIGDRKPEEVIVSCGSGVTACHTLLAMEQAGISGATLYVGSYSEWSRNELPIAKEE
jgi:thiosulfate/3-mercaptopyruvate sulfurtransferase